MRFLGVFPRGWPLELCDTLGLTAPTVHINPGANEAYNLEFDDVQNFYFVLLCLSTRIKRS